jgi:hypothetical protein
MIKKMFGEVFPKQGLVAKYAARRERFLAKGLARGGAAR